MVPLKKILVIGLEFVDPIFSGNGTLTRSIVKALLLQEYHVTVICAYPMPLLPGSSSLVNQIILPFEDVHLHVVCVPVKESSWKRLDKDSCWQEFALGAVSNQLEKYSLTSFSLVLGIDWSAYPAFENLKRQGKLHPNVNYICAIFRVFSQSQELIQTIEDANFYTFHEKLAVSNASKVFVLSDIDKQVVQSNSLSARNIRILVPPLRGDVEHFAIRNPIISIQQRKYFLCNVRLSPEKNSMFFARIIEKMATFLQERAIVPVLCGASCTPEYAVAVKQRLRNAMSNAIIVNDFLSTEDMLQITRYALLNFHPPIYDSYGMTIAEAAAVAVPTLMNHSRSIGAASLFLESNQEILTSNFLDIEETCSRLKALFDGKELLRCVGIKAREKSLSWTMKQYASALEVELEDWIHLE